MPGARLTAEQRVVIERAFWVGLPQATIAALVGKHPSTISRELRRAGSVGRRSPQRSLARGQGAGYRSGYSAKWSQREAARKARRPKARRLDHGPLREAVWELLREDWSPEQIAAMLPVLFPRDLRMRVSHETIYQSLFVQTKGEPTCAAAVASASRTLVAPSGPHWASPRTSGSPHVPPRLLTGRCLVTGRATC